MADLSGPQNEFIMVKTEYEESVTRSGRYRPKEYKPAKFDDAALKDMEQKGVASQLQATSESLQGRIMGNGDEVFYEIYARKKLTDPRVPTVLSRLSASVALYTDRKRHGMLVSGSAKKLDQVSKKDTPKYIREVIRVVRPLDRANQVDRELGAFAGTKMAVVFIIPSLGPAKTESYMSILCRFFDEQRVAMYRGDLREFGLVLADLSAPVIDRLLAKSTFVYRIEPVPEAVAQEIRDGRAAGRAVGAGAVQTDVADPGLPSVVLLDTGVNQTAGLSRVIKARHSDIFTNPDDERGRDGHGTSVAHLIAFGEGGGRAAANIISYKILSDRNTKNAPWGLLRGIASLRGQSTLFATSVNALGMSATTMAKLSRLIQASNVCLVAGAGNLEEGELLSCLQTEDYPDYLRRFPVDPPANILNVVAVGSIAQRTSDRYQSVAAAGQLSPFSKCGPGEYDIHDCRKPQVVEHGGNVNRAGRDEINYDGVGVDTVSKDGLRVNRSGTSFSAPLFARRLAKMQRVYGDRIRNSETYIALAYLSCTGATHACLGYGMPRDFLRCDDRHAVCVSEGEIGFPQKVGREITSRAAKIGIFAPQCTREIRMCLTHSDNMHKAGAPALETYLAVKARKTGNTRTVDPCDPFAADSKTNAKLLTYSFERKTMGGYWDFYITPKMIGSVTAGDRRGTTVRFGCAIMLSSRDPKPGEKPFAREVAERAGRL